MLWKNILFAASLAGAANAQAAPADAGNQMGAMGQMPSGSGAMAPMASGAKKDKGPQVPADLSGGFKKDQITLKIKFGGGHHKKGKKDKGTMSSTDMAKMPQPTDGKDGKGKGKKKGHGLTVKETEKAPKFYLGKSQGATEQSKWVIVMIDTTDDSKRMLHYVRSDYMMEPPKAGKDMGNMSNMDMGKMPQGQGQGQGQGKDGNRMGKEMKMKLNSTTAPQMQWMAPGSMGDSGAKRQYTFLMYSQQGPFPAQGMPQQGQPIDMKQFVQQNGLQPAVAGKTVNVDTTKNGTAPAAAGGAPPPGGAVDKTASGDASSFRGQGYAAVFVTAAIVLSLL